MKKLLIITILFILSALTLGVNAQVTQEWVATYNGVGTGSNFTKKCLTDKSGNIIVVGRSANLSFNDDFITLKYNSSGNLLWERRYNGIGNGRDEIVDAVLDDSNNIYVTGYSQEGASLGGYNWVTIKYYPNGDTAWKRSFNGANGNTDEPFAMAIDKYNNVCITGYIRTTPPINDDLMTLKYNSNGEILWSKVYTSSTEGTDWGYSIATDDSANIYVAGYVSVFPGNRVTTIKYNSKGDTVWIRYFPTNYGDYLRKAFVTIDKFNNVIVNGYYYIGEHYAFNTIKYNSSGDLLWNRIYKGAGNLNFCFALCTDDSANVYAAGRSTNAKTGADFVTIKYNQFGDTMWIRNYDGGFNQADEIYSIVTDTIQNVYVTGRSDFLDGTSDFMTLKYDSNGNIKWIKKYNGYDLVDRSFSICLDIDYNIIISGFSQKNANGFWITSIKYSQLTDVIENDFNFSSTSLLYQNYPNPFNPSTFINYEIGISGYVCIKVYDVLGKEIKSLVNKDESPGRKTILFKGNNYASGIYYFSLFINNKLIDSKRMLLIK